MCEYKECRSQVLAVITMLLTLSKQSDNMAKYTKEVQ